MYRVTLIGGPLSGPSFREDYLPGIVYTYPASDAEYVEVLRNKGRFQIEEIQAPKAQPKAEPSEVEAPKDDAKPAPKGKGK